MSASSTIRNAEVVLPGGVQHTDVVVLEGCIAAIGSGLLKLKIGKNDNII